MRTSFKSVRVAAAAAGLALACSIAHAQGLGPANPGDSGIPGSPGVKDVDPGARRGSSDRITAALVMRELQAMGLPAELGTDTRGMPRVSTTVDGYKWAIFFYGCTPGASQADRECVSLQFFSGYTMNAKIPMEKMNKWNTENRYARGYLFVNDDGRGGARIEVDAVFEGTGADPAMMFRAYFKIMKHQVGEFRRLINFS